MRRIEIFDTTLRDGEQSPGVALNAEEKLLIAHQLGKLGVNVLEAGFPIASPGDFEGVRRIAQEVRNVGVAALARANAKDIERAWEAISGGESPRIHTFIATSPNICSINYKNPPTKSLNKLSRQFDWQNPRLAILSLVPKMLLAAM